MRPSSAGCLSFYLVSFFDVPLPDEPPPQPVVESPVWFGPPRGVSPGYSAQRAVVFKTHDALLVVHRLLVYPSGVEFTLSLLLREASLWGDVLWELHRRPQRGSLPDDSFASGSSSATTRSGPISN